MDDSRRRSSPDGLASPPGQALDETFDGLPLAVRALAVAVSGGPDSSALAVLAAERAKARGLTLHLFHVHHGLHGAADAWAEQAAQLAQHLGLPFSHQRVDVELDDPAGLEAAARSARYAALAQMARSAGLDHILLAHHRDDQAETVMLRLLRGAGIEGMAAMAPMALRDGIVYLRPWLRVDRRQILDFIEAWGPAHGFDAVRDPSNLDPRFARGALRNDVLPAIERHWPGYRATLERFARLAGESAAVLRGLAEADLAAVQENQLSFDNSLRVSRLLALPAPRQMMVLRQWIASHGLAMPTETRLQELRRQLQAAGGDRQILMQHGATRLRRYRDWLVADHGVSGPPAVVDAPIPLRWRGEPSLRIEALSGALVFTEAPHGVDPQWLRAASLALRRRRGRERLKLAPQAPSRSLKNLYQERGIPSWERDRLPLLYSGQELVFAAGLGIDARTPQSEPGVALEWRADQPGATGYR
ncbi:hypothetical protein GCM10023144_27380 [Pigmentiphaga soli]|uniref:tRNA(Ile)-lysidine synthase n=1 Tax=Pigmentiphaga soli TaxID=1007095 RepID=A0ABP8H5U5_9BURK